VSDSGSDGYDPIQEKLIGDRRYELLSRGRCLCCNLEILEIWRWSGASFARYKLPRDFDTEEFSDYVDLLDGQFLQSSAELFADFYRELQKKNSRDGIEADYSYEFRLLEYARQRASALDKIGYLDVLTSNERVTEENQLIARLSFELGFAAAEHRLMTCYEDYLHDGIAMSEWRRAGLPKAREERLRLGSRTRNEIVAAAKRLYAADPSLVRNDTETAREILKLKLPALQKGGNQQLSLDAITRHLREARRVKRNKEN